MHKRKLTRARPKEHVRRLRSGRRILINKGVRKRLVKRKRPQRPVMRTGQSPLAYVRSAKKRHGMMTEPTLTISPMEIELGIRKGYLSPGEIERRLIAQHEGAQIAAQKKMKESEKKLKAEKEKLKKAQEAQEEAILTAMQDKKRKDAVRGKIRLLNKFIKFSEDVDNPQEVRKILDDPRFQRAMGDLTELAAATGDSNIIENAEDYSRNVSHRILSSEVEDINDLGKKMNKMKDIYKQIEFVDENKMSKTLDDLHLRAKKLGFPDIMEETQKMKDSLRSQGLITRPEPVTEEEKAIEKLGEELLTPLEEGGKSMKGRLPKQRDVREGKFAYTVMGTLPGETIPLVAPGIGELQHYVKTASKALERDIKHGLSKKERAARQEKIDIASAAISGIRYEDIKARREAEAERGKKLPMPKGYVKKVYKTAEAEAARGRKGSLAMKEKAITKMEKAIGDVREQTARIEAGKLTLKEEERFRRHAKTRVPPKKTEIPTVPVKPTREDVEKVHTAKVAQLGSLVGSGTSSEKIEQKPVDLKVAEWEDIFGKKKEEE